MNQKDYYTVVELERKLAMALQPVEPRPLFINELRNRLLYPETNNHDIEVELPKKPFLDKRYAIWGVVGLLTSTVLVGLGFRGIKALVEHLRVVNQLKKAVSPSPATTATPAI